MKAELTELLATCRIMVVLIPIIEVIKVLYDAKMSEEELMSPEVAQNVGEIVRLCLALDEELCKVDKRVFGIELSPFRLIKKESSKKEEQHANP